MASSVSTSSIRRGILLYGDPHGNFVPLLAAAERFNPSAVVLLGDLELDRPLHEKLAVLFERGISIRWIAGNHDTGNQTQHDDLFVDHPDGDLHCQVFCVGTLKIAGLAGVFRTKVFDPRRPIKDAAFATPAELIHSTPRGARFRGGLPLRHRTTIFPDAYLACSRLRAHVLVTHEAPSSHPLGWAALDDLAASMCAKLVVHGHLHDSYEAVLPNGVRVRGLGIAEPFFIEDIGDGC